MAIQFIRCSHYWTAQCRSVRSIIPHRHVVAAAVSFALAVFFASGAQAQNTNVSFGPNETTTGGGTITFVVPVGKTTGGDATLTITNLAGDLDNSSETVDVRINGVSIATIGSTGFQCGPAQSSTIVIPQATLAPLISSGSITIEFVASADVGNFCGPNGLNYEGNVAFAVGGSLAYQDGAVPVPVPSTVDKTVQTIERFLKRRNDLLLSSGPDIQRQVDRLQGSSGDGNGNSSGGTPFTALDVSQNTSLGFGASSSVAEAGGPLGNSLVARAGRATGSMGSSSLPLGADAGDAGAQQDTRISFATSLVDMAKKAAETKRRQLAGGDGNLMALGLGGVPLVEPNTYPVDIWMQGTIASYDEGSRGGRSDGDFSVLYIGADYMLSPSLLVGALIQYDHMDDFSADLGTSTESKGWMAGPYFTLRATDNIFIHGRGAWGRSDNDIQPFLTYEDNFDTERWLVEGKIHGRWTYGAWTFNPEASIAYIEEDQEAYVDTLGFAIPGQTVSLGQVRFGPRVGYVVMAADGTRLEPYAGIQGIWNFEESGTSAVAGTLASEDDFRGRVDVGLRALTVHGLGIEIQGSYDGIGADSLEAYSGDARINLPF